MVMDGKRRYWKGASVRTGKSGTTINRIMLIYLNDPSIGRQINVT
jgi:hypothetical protein